MTHLLFAKSILITIFLWAGNASAQITIKYEDYPFGPGVDSFFTDLNPSNSFIPEGGANKTWDYSKLETKQGWDYVTYKDESGNTAIATATNSIAARYSFNGLVYRARDYYRLDETGYYSVGRTQNDTSYSITALTGGANDLFRYPQANIQFPNERTLMSFPMSSTTAYDDVDIQEARFELTVAGYGLNKTPGKNLRWRFQRREVIGWGEIVIPDGKGGTTKPIEVLAVHIVDSIIDSFYLGGQPAPKPLLDAFGAVQGNTWKYEAYAFETIGLGRQVAGLITGTDNIIDQTYFRPQAAQLTVGSNELAQPIVNVFPSNVQNGQVITIESSNSNGSFQVALISANGKEIQLTEIGNNKFQLPSNVQAGLYVYRLVNQENQHSITGKLMVIN
ncbi:MAG: T9SS type A sorting domain-containing protein [Bacteroidetes bacterium]|nr:T9SS type A sorting domain-containing protein [Bacteroidota bacterium]